MKTTYQNLTTKIEDGVGWGGRSGLWGCSKHTVNANSPLYKRDGNWVEKTFARLLGLFVAKDNEKWPIADRHVPSNYPRNTCGTHFGSSSPLISKVVNKTLQ